MITTLAATPAANLPIDTTIPLGWLALGLLGQGLFFSRFLVQWIVSERRKKSVVPRSFWILSLSGAMLLLAYSIYRHDPVFILGQSTGFLVYTRNLMLLRGSASEPA